MRYVYPCSIVPDEEEKSLTGIECYTVTFRDVPEAITGGDSWQEAVEMAIDALEVAISFYVDMGKDIPVPSPMAEGEVMVPMPPLTASKLALYSAMREQGVSCGELAGCLQVSEDAVRKMVDPTYRTRIRQIEIALLALGRAVATEDWQLDDRPPELPELVGSEAGALGQGG